MESLHARVERAGPLEATDAAGWVVRLCKRVEELHRLGVAHGSISAHCVLVADGSCSSEGMLADVRSATSRPGYQSPERLAGGGISTEDDTWAAAVTLYYLLTGALPFVGETSAEIRESMSRPPSPLAVFDAGDDRLQALLDRFLGGERERALAVLREGLERWRGAGAPLPPLEDEDDESFVDDEDDDDEEDVATVMRDFSNVREQLQALQQHVPNPASDAPDAGAALPAGGSEPQTASASSTAAAAPSPRARRPPPPPGAAAPPRPGASAPEASSPSSPAAGVVPAIAAIDDDDSDEVATVMLDADHAGVRDAIDDALAQRRARGEQAPASAAPENPAAVAAPEAAGAPGGGASDPTADLLGDSGPPAEAPGFGVAGEPFGASRAPGASPAPDASPALGAAAESGAAPVPASSGGEAAAGAAGLAPAGPGPAASGPSASGPSASGPSASGPSVTGAGPPASGALASGVGSDSAAGASSGAAPTGGAAPPPQAQQSSGLRVALYVASGLLVVVICWIGLLLLERYGVLTLPI